MNKNDVLKWIDRKYGMVRPAYLAEEITSSEMLLEIAYSIEGGFDTLQDFVRDLQSYETYANILNLFDEHKMEKDPKNIKGYREAMRLVHKDKLDIIDEYRITDIHHAGDIYDRGYESKPKFYTDITRDRELSDKVNGNYYEVGGNHTYRDVDRNAELYLIQPCPRYPTKEKVEVDTPVIKIVDKRRIGNVQFNFFHWDKFDKNYYAPRDPDTEMNVGYYHDECVIPSCVNLGNVGNTNVNSDYLNKIFSNIDIAVIGHWHISVEPFTIRLANGHPVLIIIAGSIGITSIKKEERHPHVMLPLFKIRGTKFNLEYIKFSTHLEVMEFKEEKFKEKGEVTEHLLAHERESDTPITGKMIKFDNLIENHKTLEDTLIQNVDQFAPDYYRLAAKGELTFNKAVLLSHGRRE